MAKLYFRHGTVGSAKTLNLLAVAHNYGQQNKKALVLKPRLDDRFGERKVQSRAGLSQEADYLIDSESDLSEVKLDGISCLLVDEAQFLDPDQIDSLRNIAHHKDIPVICYGLRTDFRRRLFDGATRLIELADAIEEIKSTCNFCNKKAIYNMKLVGGVATLNGPQVDLGAEEKYLPACGRCYDNSLKDANPTRLSIQ